MKMADNEMYLLTHSQFLSRENYRRVSQESEGIFEECMIGTLCCRLLGKSEVPLSALLRSSAAVVYTYLDPGWLTNLGQRRALDSDLKVGPVTLGSVSQTCH